MNTHVSPPKLTVKVGQYLFASPDMKNRRMESGKRWSGGVILQHNIDVVLSHHNNRHSKRKKVVSFSTMQKRAYEIKSAGWLLFTRGENETCRITHPPLRLLLPTNIGKRHILKLTHTWEQNPGLTPATIIQKLSIFRVFLSWLDKDHLLTQIPPAELFTNPELISRTLATTENKSWDKVDVESVIEAVGKENKYIARQLRLSHHFGMRVKESMMFRPHRDYDQIANMVHIRRGAKSGHQRSIKITNDAQRAILEDAMEHCAGVYGSMMPKRVKLKEWMKHYYYILNKHGISRSQGIVPHGLRHGFAHRIYEEQTGVKPRVTANEQLEIPLVKDQIARLFVSNQLGHSRQSISSAYGI